MATRRPGRLRVPFTLLGIALLGFSMIVSSGIGNKAQAQVGPSMVDPNLGVRTVIRGLTTPISLAFLSPNEFFVLEKNTGQVKLVVNGVVDHTVLDLAVNNSSERGLLSIALHPQFLGNGFVYLYWTESSTGQDTGDLLEVPLLGNRVDRFVWDGFNLIHDQSIIMLRAFQQDAGQPPRGNHNGGVIRFGRDGKLYIIMGDNGRRGFLQNNQMGPVPDDQFGGPEPDLEHNTGVILRINDNGSTPFDNPFFNVTTGLGAEVDAVVKLIFAYGIRNSFGMAVDPVIGDLWQQENGDDSFDEINRVDRATNLGWVQTMGPVSRVSEFKAIEVSRPGGLQQIRWPPSLIADTPEEALSRLYMLPGASYSDPEFSWKFAVAPAGLGFIRGATLGAEYSGDLVVGASIPNPVGGYLFRFDLTKDRKAIAVTDSRLADLVADNLDKFDITESESLLFGRNFGIGTDIQSSPLGTLFVVSLSNGAVYEIFRR
jgi:aldose sugar dehydrogenase